MSVAQPARALIDSSVNFLQPKIRNVRSSGSVATAVTASSVSFSQFRTLSEVRDGQPAAMALIDSSVRFLHRETLSESKELQLVPMAVIDSSVRNLQSATLSEVRDGQLVPTAFIDSSVRSLPQCARLSDRSEHEAIALIASSVRFLQPETLTEVSMQPLLAMVCKASSVRFPQPETSSEVSKEQSTIALIDSSVSFEQPATLSEVSEVQPERMALNDSSVSKGLSETSSKAVAVIPFDLSPSALLDNAIRTLPTKPATGRATAKIKRRLSCIKCDRKPSFQERGVYYAEQNTTVEL